MRVGVDVGTSVTKAAVFGPDGALTSVRSRATDMLRPAPGCYEHDSDQVFSAVLDLLTELDSDQVDLIAITGQGDGLWLLDAGGAPARAAMSWMDNRGAPDCRSWAGNDVTETIFRRTGNAPFPGAGAALLSALDRLEPDALTAADTATQCQHAIMQGLTGARAATRSAAMLGVFDPATGAYDTEAIRLTGLSHYTRLLPTIAAEAAAIAPIRPELARRTGIRPGTLVASGPYDLPAAAFGAGVTGVGDGLLIIGTTLACLVVHPSVPTGGEPAGLTLCVADDSGYLRAMPAMVGTAGLDWILNIVGAAHADLDTMLRTSAAGANGVAALPYLSPAGERAPFVDPAASAEFTGLNLATTPADLVRALCESLAYAARHCFQAAGLAGTVTVCGGGSASGELVRVFADVLGRPIAVVDQPETTARGAVLAAGAALDAAADVAGTIPRATPAATTLVQPSPGNRTRYDDGYAAYLDRVRTARSVGWPGAARSSQFSQQRFTYRQPAEIHGLRAPVKE
jgi:sugar (pentulose or hexulose) kinase